MTGLQHYRGAEKLVADAADADPGADPAKVALLLQFAQVHATLALAAATAELAASEGPGGGSAAERPAKQGNAWAEVLA